MRSYPEWHRDGYTISTDPARLDLDVIHGFLTTCYWAEGIPHDIVKRSVENSLCFGVYHGQEQIGFARVITDYATFGYLGDVFILVGHRGRGLSRWLMDVILGHPALQGFRRFVLLTRDAHELYRRSGFTALSHPERYMERWAPGAYRK